MEIEQLRFLCKDETIQMTDHVYKKSRQRNIKFDDIKRCIMYGQIIEDYPNDFPFPSALILECSVGKTHSCSCRCRRWFVMDNNSLFSR